MEKKEMQKKIIEIANRKPTDEEFNSILKLVSPGTNLRHALDGIVKSNRGAIILMENEFSDNIIEGGFRINCRFTPQRLIELAKMDGAIVLSKDMKRILYANVLLTPDSRIPSNETGTRHKAAERSAKMIGSLTIAVSERKNEINLYFKTIKYHVKDTHEIMGRTTNALHILEKQRELFDSFIEKLDESELKDETSLNYACKTIQKGKSMQEILKTMERNLIELGSEGRALKFRVQELMKGVEKETNLIVKDYTNFSLKKSKNLLEGFSYDELMDSEKILNALALSETNISEPIKGWRMLSRTPLTDKETAIIIKELGNLKNILNASEKMFSEIVGKDKATTLIKSLTRLKSDIYSDLTPPKL